MSMQCFKVSQLVLQRTDILIQDRELTFKVFAPSPLGYRLRILRNFVVLVLVLVSLHLKLQQVVLDVL